MAPLLSGTAFITGAAQGIGLQTALAFAEHGIQNLALADVNKEVLTASIKSLKERYPNINVLQLHIDVRNEQEVQSGIAEIVEKFGRLDIAVNNAGIRGPVSNTDETGEAAWANLVDVNLTGVWRCQKEELRVMKGQEDKGLREGRGRIINMSSMFGLSVPFNGLPLTAYTAAKHGVVGLTKADAVLYGRQGIRLNAICPGFARTEWFPSGDATTPLALEVKRSALSRPGEVEEIADCIVFLASPMSSFMQGASLVADGGFTLT
ncbi:3-oxoacyl-reductase [Xylariales sp. AK1849]|nr:3-oxoacyl-reductase [Xylariales sp. AK1849]